MSSPLCTKNIEFSNSFTVVVYFPCDMGGGSGGGASSSPADDAATAAAVASVIVPTNARLG